MVRFFGLASARGLAQPPEWVRFGFWGLGNTQKMATVLDSFGWFRFGLDSKP